ncbi:IQ calmodulin-binding motif-containing protein 1 [Strongylocentrotus purpuratus]|uniref:IQ calmodulin-binding motif-containing protein 1 n=1 Tax=Strongylocentrotus purpuratus TaxID=7668 RepID=A0A7M7MZE9_STRPU|nr:IQ calmodulin-binding motif-containing protein 1 [Strongylocentrotus purpuratus]
MMASNDPLEDKRVEDLASHLAETTDKNVPNLLLALQDILDSVVPGSQRADKIKKDIWNFELLQSVLLALKQDFSLINGKWNTAAALAKILAHCSVGLDPPDSHEFHALFLPDAAERLLILSRNIQHRYCKIPEKTLTLKDDLIKNFKEVVDSLQWLYSGHLFLTTNVLRSNYLLQMLITDDRETSIILLGMVQSAVRVNSLVLNTLDEKVVHSVLDEIIFKLSAFNDAEIGAAATRALVNIADVHTPLIRLLYTRYKGLRPLLSRWTGRGFGRDLKRLLALLDAGSAQQAELHRLHRAATTIQAIWKGFLQRKKLKKANRGLATLQRSYRAKKVEKSRIQEYEREQKELEHQLLMARRKAIRETRQKQLDMISAMPPGDVNKYLAMSQIQCAIRIQARWRGVLERRKLGLRKATARQVKAAITIQRHARRFLKKQEEKKKEPLLWQPPPGLDDDRRVELQKVIDEKRNKGTPKERNREAQEELHKQAQEMLLRYFAFRGKQRKTYQKREALLASLETDADLLTNAPKLEDASNRDVYTFTSHSAPIAAKALSNHREELLLLRQPWWRKLHIEEKTDDEIAEEYDTEFKIL